MPEMTKEDLRSTLETLDRAMDDYGPPFAPTSFWRPAVAGLLADFEQRGPESFKSWPSAQQFFYPQYGQRYSQRMLDELKPELLRVNRHSQPGWATSRLVGGLDAHRDMDIALAMLDRSVMDYDFLAFGESEVGRPPQRFRLDGADGPAFGRAYLNYAKILAALSRFVDREPQTYLELGGGFGVLGELLQAHNPSSVYIDCDIPPLIGIAAWYLNNLFPQRCEVSPTSTDPAASFDSANWGSGFIGCIPSWDLPKVPRGAIDVFVNSFSFQEMEPATVGGYAEIVANQIQARYVVSLNSAGGKPVKSENREVGVVEPTTSAAIANEFVRRGYEVIADLGRPASPPQAKLVILRRA